ncbi:hypothetical protein [Clostridium grantii]|uniref:Glucose / Sorbosone dehydrogenase n=1 Tax=Clostridium grantii DSM 8605 TaxID=1121316 RepID=A0A1M5RGA3_9CLOT|nr:hypothetical protein [Clostridium grantii]SHH25335.1 hypothetical protein SAMN02745207_00517 [Clostridium grantii DSM 8605]
MKDYIKIVFKFGIVVLLSIFSTFILNKYLWKEYSIDLFEENMSYNLKYKGIIDSTDFTFDENNNCYISYNNRVQVVEENGKSYDILKNENLNIYSMEYYCGSLFFVSNNYLYKFEIDNKELTEIMKDLPNYGDYNKSIIKQSEGFLYITIGAATNSGVVGKDNLWTREYPFNHDLTPYKINLRGINHGESKTGAFVNENSKSVEGQIVPAHFPGNASVIIYNLETGDRTTFAWGIRNIKGLDFNSRSQLLASVGGMENRGERPIKGDSDYIYEIKSKNWYGWPDFSGGDPISSPRFTDGEGKMVFPVLDNHPNENPPAPIYQSDNINEINCLAIDKWGTLGEIDGIYFYDNCKKSIYLLNFDLVLKKIVEINNNDKIQSIKFYKNGLYVMDSKNGILYSIHIVEKGTINRMNYKMIFSFIVTLVFILIFYLAWTSRKYRKLK